MAAAAALLALLDLAVPQARADDKQISATCKVTDEFPLPTSPDTVPVMITYMKNSRQQGDDVQTKLSKSRLTSGFESGGEFNAIWRSKGIVLALVGFRSCLYTLGPGFELNPPRHDVPKPDATAEVFESVFLTLVRDLNTRTVKSGSRDVAFKGLDLYLWWDIAGYPGFGVRPRFGRQHEATGRGADEPALGRPGAVWLDRECVGPPDTCGGLLAHEVGHFLGLCHCCHGPTDNPVCINGLRPEYCPGLGRRTPQPISCGTSDVANRLMSATNPHVDPRRRELLDCEVAAAREGARKVLEFGGNGIPDTGGR